MKSGYSGYQLARVRAVFDERRDRGRVRLAGADARSFLHALVTNDVTALAPGRGCYAALLTPQGRMITDMTVLVPPEGPPALLLDVPSDAAGALAGRLDQSIFTEDVTVEDVSSSTAQFSVMGPLAAEALDAVLFELGYPPVASDLHAPFASQGFAGDFDDGFVWRADLFDPIGVPTFEVVVPASMRDSFEVQVARRAVELGPDARTALRIEAGRPAWGADMTSETIPLEAGLLDRAISTGKGCYVGQEVIIRVLHRGGGRVAKKLARLDIEGGGSQVPARGDALFDGEKEAGRITSAAWSPHQERIVALGYVQRDHAIDGARLRLEDGRSVAVVSVL